MQLDWPSLWPPTPAIPDARHGIQGGFKHPAIVHIRSGNDNSQRCAMTIHDQMALAAELASVRWVWASVLPAARRSHCGRVKTGTRKIQLVKPMEAVQQLVMERGPDACLLPFAQAPPACHPAATPKCERKVVPGYACFTDTCVVWEQLTLRLCHRFGDLKG
jgi:hypothetical protein